MQDIEFHDAVRGPMLIRELEGTPWLCYKHPDGQWVTLRKVTDEDIAMLKSRHIVW